MLVQIVQQFSWLLSLRISVLATIISEGIKLDTETYVGACSCLNWV